MLRNSSSAVLLSSADGNTVAQSHLLKDVFWELLLQYPHAFSLWNKYLLDASTYSLGKRLCATIPPPSPNLTAPQTEQFNWCSR